MKKTIVLVGMMGAGKTAVGSALARALHVPFVDSDAAIEAAANATIAEIFTRDGEAFFRAREREVIGRLLEGEACVLATGGGVFMNEQNRKLISEKGAAIWLNADLELLWSRVRHKDTRPLLQTDDPKGTLAEIYAKRTPTYALADLSVVCDPNYSIAQTVDAVAEALHSRADVLELP